MKTFKTFFSSDKVISFILYFSILAFIIAFNFSDHGGGGWQLQNLPFLNDRPLRDMTFTDSLTGYGITKGGNNGDSDYVIKTTNGGNNWFIAYTTYNLMNRIIFLNPNTGFICGSKNWYSSGLVLKTTNSGTNWFPLNASFALKFDDMFVLNEDTIWLVDDNGFSGGVFRTLNGGNSWLQQWSGYSPNKIYMVNKDIGYINGNAGMLIKTTNGGFNWSIIPGQNGFNDMSFVDTLTGWKCSDSMKMTTDGGATWNEQRILISGSSMGRSIASFSNIGKDTIWGGGVVYEFPNLQSRGVVHYTTNGGLNWFFQIPDTSFRLPGLTNINFVNHSTGWLFSTSKGIHTKTGGDSIFIPITKIKNENYYTPENFHLFQNYPNPFNPKTKILYELNLRGKVLLKVFNSLGKEIVTLVDQIQNIGEHKVDFDGSGFSSGVYFYSLFIDNEIIDTKKMMMIR